MLKNSEKNGMGEIGLVTRHSWSQVIPGPAHVLAERPLHLWSHQWVTNPSTWCRDFTLSPQKTWNQAIGPQLRSFHTRTPVCYHTQHRHGTWGQSAKNSNTQIDMRICKILIFWLNENVSVIININKRNFAEKMSWFSVSTVTPDGLAQWDKH